jgi:hypothetical protein
MCDEPVWCSVAVVINKIYWPGLQQVNCHQHPQEDTATHHCANLQDARQHSNECKSLVSIFELLVNEEQSVTLRWSTVGTSRDALVLTCCCLTRLNVRSVCLATDQSLCSSPFCAILASSKAMLTAMGSSSTYRLLLLVAARKPRLRYFVATLLV